MGFLENHTSVSRVGFVFASLNSNKGRACCGRLLSVFKISRFHIVLPHYCFLGLFSISHLVLVCAGQGVWQWSVFGSEQWISLVLLGPW